MYSSVTNDASGHFSKTQNARFCRFWGVEPYPRLTQIPIFWPFFASFHFWSADVKSQDFSNRLLSIFQMSKNTRKNRVFRFWTLDFTFFNPSEVDSVTLEYTQICSKMTFFHFFAKSGKTVIFGDFSWKIAVLDQVWHRTTPWVMSFWTLNGIFVTCGPVWAVSQCILAL